MITETQRQLAALMVQELDQMKLQVCVIPDGRENSHRKVRCVVVPNPDWYSRMCEHYLAPRSNPKWKRMRTNIKRFFVRKTLDRISRGILQTGKYGDACLDALDWVMKTRGEVAPVSTHTHR